MRIRGLGGATLIALVACSTSEAPTPSQPAAMPDVGAPLLVEGSNASSDHPAPLPSEGASVDGPTLPPDQVSLLTHDQYRLTLLPHGEGIPSLEARSGDAVDLLANTSVVDEPAPPPADLDVE